MSTAPGQFFHGFADAFDSIYDSKRGPLMRAFDRRFRSDMFIRFAKSFEFLGDFRDKRVLDVGCGSGPYMVEALRRGAAEVTGIDAAPRMLELAEKRLESAGVRDRAKLVEGTFPGAPVPGAPYDYAIVMGVMDYIADAPAFVRGLRENVTEAAVLSFPSKHWLRTPVRDVRYKLRGVPLWFYTEERIAGLMRESGVREWKTYKIPGSGMDFVVRMVP